MARQSKHVYGVTLPPRVRHKPELTPSVCLDCGEEIDTAAASRAYKEHRDYRHACGRILVHGRMD